MSILSLEVAFESEWKHYSSSQNNKKKMLAFEYEFSFSGFKSCSNKSALHSELIFKQEKWELFFSPCKQVILFSAFNDNLLRQSCAQFCLSHAASVTDVTAAWYISVQIRMMQPCLGKTEISSNFAPKVAFYVIFHEKQYIKPIFFYSGLFEEGKFDFNICKHQINNWNFFMYTSVKLYLHKTLEKSTLTYKTFKN